MSCRAVVNCQEPSNEYCCFFYRGSYSSSSASFFVFAMSNELLKGDAKALGKVHPESRKAAQMSRAARKETNKSVREKVKDKAKIEHVSNEKKKKRKGEEKLKLLF
jgi:hypothetical protein